MKTTETKERETATPVPLMQMATGFWVSNTLSSALELDLFSLLSGKTMTREEIKRQLNLETRPARMLLSACTSLGLLEKKGEHYSNAPLSESFLVRGKPYYFGGFVEMLQKRLYLPWHELTDALKKNKPKAAEKSGPMFEFFAKNPEMGKLFMGAMHSLSSFSAAELGRKVDLTPYTTLMDVGGGSGAFCIELAKAYPRLSCTIFDLPQTCEIASHYVQEAGMQNRVRTLAGDFFKDELPAGHDLMLLSFILHDWTPEQNLKLIKRCFKALNPGGKILIVELFTDDDETGPLQAALMSLNMLIEIEGMSYTWQEYEEWLKEAGFKNLNRVPMEGAHNGALVAQKL